MAKDFFRKRVAPLSRTNPLPPSKSPHIEKIANAPMKLRMDKVVVPKGIGFQNQFKKIMEDQEDK